MALYTAGYRGIAYHKVIDLDAPVYKFFPLNRLLEVMEKNELYFRNILTWDDNWELPTHLFQTDGLEELEGLYFKKDVIHPTYASCFTEEFDTDALWRIYSVERNSVCIETTARLLLRQLITYNEIISAYFAPVIYCKSPYLNPESILNIEVAREYPHQFYASFLKRRQFSHEKELRLAIQTIGFADKQKEVKKGICLPVNIEKIIRRIILDPRLTKQEFDCYREKFCSLDVPIEQSILYTEGEFNGKQYSALIRNMYKCDICGSMFAAFTKNDYEKG